MNCLQWLDLFFFITILAISGKLLWAIHKSVNPKEEKAKDNKPFIRIKRMNPSKEYCAICKCEGSYRCKKCRTKVHYECLVELNRSKCPICYFRI